MDVYRKIECLELLIALAYYLRSERKAPRPTRLAFLSMACALVVDIVFLRGQKPRWGWYLLNVPFLWYIYEKNITNVYALGCPPSGCAVRCYVS